MKGTLFSKVSLLLTISMILSALGTYMGQGITSTAAIIALAVAFLGGAFVTMLVAKANTVAGIACLAVWTFVSGLFLGPCIHQYIHILGWSTVFLAYLGTAGVMAVCGVIGALSGINFGKLQGFLMVALLGLIVVGLVNIFIGFGHVGTLLYAGIGMLVFAGFFLVDFFRLANDGDDSWSNAVDLTMNLYLDYINFLLYLLRFLAVIFGGSSSSKD